MIGQKYVFLMDLCKDITSGGELNDIAISCGIELRNVETALANWPTDIGQVSLQILLNQPLY